MKIIEIHNRYRSLGGEEVIFDMTCNILKEKGHSVSIFERDSRNIIGLSGRICAFLDGIYSISAKKALISMFRSERPDIVDVHNLYPLISPSVLVACKEYDVPVVMRRQNYRLVCPIGVHFRKDFICELCVGRREYWCALNNCKGNICESIGYALRNIFARKSNIIQDNVAIHVPPTEFVKQRLIGAGFSEDRIIVVPNVISVPESVFDPNMGKYVGYVGRISPEKGIKTLLVAGRKTGYPIHIGGDYSSCAEIVKSGPQNVKFVGHLDRNQLAEFYRNARFLVVPSIWFEAFGIVVIEAMSHGLPVIASNIGGLPEIVKDGVNGFLFEAGNAEDLAEKMKILWERPILCRQMGQAAHRMAINEFNETVYYNKLINVFEKAIQIGN